MQNKYLSALKTKYASFGLSKEALDRVALQRVKTIANESEIESDLANPETFLLLMKEQQGANDALRSSNNTIQKQLDELKNSNTPPKQDPPQENPLGEQFAEMQKALEEMKEKFAASERRAQTEAVIAEVHKKMKSMGCTNDFIRDTTLRGIEVKEGDTADSIAEKCKEAYDANCKKAFGDGYVPPKGNDKGGDEIDFSAMIEGLKASGDIPK